MGLGHRLQAMLRALFGPEPGPTAEAEKRELHQYDERWLEQVAALDLLEAEMQLAQRGKTWHNEAAQSHSGSAEGEPQ